VNLDTPSAAANVRVEGSLVPGASLPLRTACLTPPNNCSYFGTEDSATSGTSWTALDDEVDRPVRRFVAMYPSPIITHDWRDWSLTLKSTLFTCDGGCVVLPDLVLVGREDGGHLVVNPPRVVWERSELTAVELCGWSALVAATGRAMIDSLPQLADGCVNYWEAGNWALHADAEPAGPKTVRAHRQVHAHLLGRSPDAIHPSWRWGEAPRFPAFVDRFSWAAEFERLTAGECAAIVSRLTDRLGGRRER
jgi:hypothetical protein